MKRYVEVEEAIEILDRSIKPIGAYYCNILEALNKVSAREVISEVNNPSFNKSVMDGYAVVFSESYSKALKITGTTYAGDNINLKVEEGQAVNINTGGKLPIGANAVVKKEDVTVIDDSIIINTKIKKMQNISLEGEDIKKGDIVLRKNKIINHADIGILATAGIDKINVYRGPKIAIITTGSELIDINEELRDGKIYNSNKYWLNSKLGDLNYEVIYIENEIDNIDRIKDRVKEALVEADIVITTGGVSVGEKDYLKDVIKKLNGEILFWKVNIKPGSAFLASRVENKFILSLSGNPNAALTTFELLVVPALRKLSGCTEVYIEKTEGYLINDYCKASNKRRYLRGKLSLNNGRVEIEALTKYKGNGTLLSAVESNCLIEIQSGTSELKKGDLVKIIPV